MDFLCGYIESLKRYIYKQDSIWNALMVLRSCFFSFLYGFRPPQKNIENREGAAFNWILNRGIFLLYLLRPLRGMEIT